MGLFDDLKKQVGNKISGGINNAIQKQKFEARKSAKDAVSGAVKNAVNGASHHTQKVVFDHLPANLADLKTLPGADLKDPAKVTALAVAALCAYPTDREACIEMLNYLRGPRPLSGHDLSLINDRFMDGQTYIPISYFEGTSPENDYTPSMPYTIEVVEGPYARQNEGYLRLDMVSSGADAARYIVLRNKPSTGEWFLWEQYILVGIRIPKSKDVWA